MTGPADTIKKLPSFRTRLERAGGRGGGEGWQGQGEVWILSPGLLFPFNTVPPACPFSTHDPAASMGDLPTSNLQIHTSACSPVGDQCSFLFQARMASAESSGGQGLVALQRAAISPACGFLPVEPVLRDKSGKANTGYDPRCGVEATHAVKRGRGVPCEELSLTPASTP